MPDVSLYCGDCVPVMRERVEDNSVITLTDPPYGINFINGGGRNPQNGWRTFYDSEDTWDKERPSKECFEEILRISKRSVIWGGNYFTDYLPPSQQWLIWDKGQRGFSLADAELAWSSQDKATRIFTFHRGAMLTERVEHPTQKPVALMIWCIELISKPGDTIFDPFMGSGTTGVACMKTGRNFIGIEIERKYYDIAEKRIKEAQMQPTLPWEKTE